jgi:peptide/nickel transport system substrate-binding protein
MTMTRRGALGLAAGLATASGGCLQRTRSLFGRGSARQLSLSIKTVPADSNRAATRIARRLGEHLAAAGMDVSVVLETEDELRRSVLINHDFDLYVAQYPDHNDPDFLRPLLHSVFVDEPGWQNPFGFVDLDVDDLLDRQRTSEGTARQRAVAELLRTIAANQPFTVIGYPDEVRATRTDRYEGWRSPGLASSIGYLSLRRSGDATGDGERLNVTITDERVTRNFNPIAVEFRNQGTITGLLYDPLARRSTDGLLPWVAEEWDWAAAGDGRTTARVRLRTDLAWHDGHPLTAEDVAFTYVFLQDTSLGEGSVPAPAPRFRGRVSLIESVEAVDERTVRFDFGDTSPAVAVRTFTVPILPEHEWRPQSSPAAIAGLDLFEGVTEALIWDNPDPVGSGVLRFERSIVDESLTLRRFDDHFLARGGGPADRFDGGIAFEELTARVAPSDEAAVGLVAAGEADGTASSVGPHVVPTIGRNEDVQLVVTPSRSFYHVGFNVRREPLGNPRFRRAVSRLIDKRYTADTVFDGYAMPSASPMDRTDWTPSDLRWIDEDPTTPFVGTAGELDVPAAKELFREIGYEYDNDDRLVNR